MLIYFKIGLPWWLSGKKICLPTQEMQVRSLGREDTLEKETTAPLSILPGQSHGQRRLVGYNPWGCKRVEHDLAAKQQ